MESGHVCLRSRPISPRLTHAQFSAKVMQKLTSVGRAAMLQGEVAGVDAEPRYNIRAVERLTGVPAPTLRSWERRYGFPTPARTNSSRRLYSDDDVRVIRWVRSQTERGLSAAQAIEWAQTGGSEQDRSGGPALLPSPAVLVQAQIDAVHHYDEQAVETALTTAFAHYPADHVLTEVITPALVEVGELWARGEIPVAAEHFYSNIIRRRLLSLLAAQPAITPRMTAALACLPGEQHELGLLMLALFLRWAGARVLYLGSDLPVRDIIRLAQTRDIDAICLSAGSEASWDALETLVGELPDAPHTPRIYLGGPAARMHPAPDRIIVLDLPLADAAAIIVTGTESPIR
jgi:MerR family transcriptional regulator, light-induced transcriptional regulator